MSDPAAIPGLEYPLLFGLPGNKTEVVDGRMRTLWPLQDLRNAERAYGTWSAQIERWRGSSSGITIERQCRVLEMEIPVNLDFNRSFWVNFWHRGLWGAEPQADLPGEDSPYRLGHVRMNLWRAFKDVGETDGKARWRQCCYGDVMLADDVSLFLDLYYYREESPMRLIGGDFPAGAPLFAAQILAPFSREVDRGQRLALLHRSGVRYVWLIDPADETVDALEWQTLGYAHQQTLRPGDTIRPAFDHRLEVSIAEVLEDPYGDRAAGRDDEARGGERGPAGAMGLEYPLLLGHPGRRHEIWVDHSPCVLALASVEEARDRFHELLADAGRWTGNTPAKVLQLSGDVEAARAAPFQLTRRRNRIHLDVEVDPHIYRGMLEALADRGVWDERNSALEE